MTTTTENLLPEVAAFLSSSPVKAFIGGNWVAAEDGATLTTCDPGTGAPLAKVPAMGARDIDLAVQAASAAFRRSGWAEMPPNERGALLHRLADAVERHKPILAGIEARDAGKILAQAEGDIQNFVDTLRYFIEMSQHIQRRTPLAVKGHEATTVRLPWGPCGFIFPWNFPFLLIGWGNLRGVRESGTMFAAPTYVFIMLFLMLILVGLFRLATGSLNPAAAATFPAFQRSS